MDHPDDIGRTQVALALAEQQRQHWIKRAALPAKPLTLPLAMPSDAKEWAVAYCDGKLADPGQGLALTGKAGLGKTTTAVHILKFVLENGNRLALGYDPETNVYARRAAYFTSYYDFIRDQKVMWKLERAGQENSDDYVELEERITSVTLESVNPRWWAKLVVLDDVGKEYRSGTGWAESELNGLLRLRHRYGCPTIITSNFALSEWTDTYGDALGSFAREAFLEIPVEGKDRR